MAFDPHKGTSLSASFDHLIGRIGDGGGGSDEASGGRILYVNNDTTNLPDFAQVGADRLDYGQEVTSPLATIDFAIGLCTANRQDKIVVLPGHSETLTAAITMDVAGVTVECWGRNTERPQISSATASIDLITITAANCKIQNLVFNEVTAAVNSLINVAAAGTVIEGCQFDLGASNTNPPITWASGDDFKLLNNDFIITANGPAVALEIESTTDGLVCTGNVFNGGSTTNTFDTAAINSGQAHTNALIDDNIFMYGTALVVATSISTAVGSGNQYLVGAISNAAAPQRFYCDLGTTIRDGKSPETPTTLNDAVVTKATAGDKVFVLAGSTVTLTSGQAMSVAGVHLIGLGVGANRPQITGNGTDDLIDMSAASCKIENMGFPAATGTQTSIFNVSAADCEIKGCEVLCGASNTNGIITLASGATNVNIFGNELRVTANGPAIGISVESTIDNMHIKGNLFNGGSATNQWDTAAINSTQAHTNAVIEDNRFLYGTAMVVATSVSTTVRNNDIGTNAASTATTPKLIYVDNGSTLRDGFSPETPTTLANAIDTLARSGAGDTILCMPGTYTISATLAIDSAGLVIKPFLDNGTKNVTITTTSDVDLFTVTAANTEIKGLRLLANSAQTTTPVLISYATGDFNRVHDCFFDCANIGSMQAITTASGSTDNLIDHNYFTGQVTAVSQIGSLGARTNVWDNFFDLQNADASAWTNDAHAVDGDSFIRNYLQADGGSRAVMIVPDVSAPVQFLVADNIFGGTTTNTPFAQDAEFTAMFINNYAPGATVSGGFLIDPVA